MIFLAAFLWWILLLCLVSMALSIANIMTYPDNHVKEYTALALISSLIATFSIATIKTIGGY